MTLLKKPFCHPLQIYKDYSHRVNVKIGKNAENGAHNFFSINTFDGSKTVPRFNVERGDCNASIVGSRDGTIYPQKITKDMRLTLWRNELCRPATFTFEEEVQKGSIHAYKFSMPDNAYDRIEDQEDCFKGFGRKPLPDGLSDVSRCLQGKAKLLKNLLNIFKKTVG